MKFVANENMYFEVVKALRNMGFEVYSIAESNFSINDTAVLKIAFEQNAILLTQDKDFGELVYRFKLPNHGVILLRLNPEIGISNIIASVINLIEKHKSELENAFTVLEKDKVRIKHFSI